MSAEIVPLVDEGLGNTAYLVDLGDGRALAVDASRDLRALRATAQRRALRVAFAADTHLHADFLTGALQLAADDRAVVLASHDGERAYPHRGLRDGDEVDLGGLTLRTLATPGHTHEHVSFLLLDGARTVGVFTGGSLIVGAAARTDLVAPDLTVDLARAQHRSLRRLATLDDDVAVWPTHGAGSFCSAPPGAERTSTIGAERATNPLFGLADEDAFVTRLLGSLGSYPDYFGRLAEVNRRGPALVEGSGLAALTPGEVAALRDRGAEVVDVRPAVDFAAGHVPGSLSIPLRPAFATWLGWLVAPDRPLVVVRDADQDPDEVLWQARKIGYDDVAGELAGGVPAWAAAGHPLRSLPLADAASVDGGEVLDVRQDDEYAAGHLPASRHVELGSLPATAGTLTDTSAGRPVVVMCGHGERAMGAASVLARAGHQRVSVLLGGPDGWAETTGRNLETGR